EFIFDRENYLSFPNEISFYAALTLRDRDRLESIFKDFITLSERVFKDASEQVRNGRFLEEFTGLDERTTQDELLEIQREIKTQEQIEEDRKALLEGSDFVQDGSSQEVARPKYENDDQRWLPLLVLVSGMVKHMELIPDWDK